METKVIKKIKQIKTSDNAGCAFFIEANKEACLGIINQIKTSGANSELELIGVVMTMYDGRTNLAQQVVNEVRKHFGDKVFKTLIPRTVRLAEAPSFGKPITVYDPGSYAAMVYRSLTDELLARAVPATPAP